LAVAYRDPSEEEREAALRVEVATLETRITDLEAQRSAIASADRGRIRATLRMIVRPWALFVLVLALGAGFYVGSVFHVVDRTIGGPCR
jgi:hypothetical protein